MIKKLRLKFLLVMTSVLTVFFAVVILLFNLTPKKMGEFPMDRRMREIAQEYSAGDEHPPRDRDPGAFQYMLPGFSVSLNKSGEIDTIYKNGEINTSDEEITGMAQTALQSGNESGTAGKFRYLIVERPNGKTIVFLDNSFEENINYRLRQSSILIGAVCIVALIGISYFLSRWIVKPVAENFEKQKQFISNASHELKTPLTVINANADVLRNEIGDNKWLSYIKSESQRMSALVNSLLSLARVERGVNTVMSQVDLGGIIMKIVLPFESVAFEAKIDYSYDIACGVYCRGNPETLMQLASILIDNAVKNTQENGEVKISLRKKGGKACFEVYNTGKGIDLCEQKKIFERFYKCGSGSNSDGYGLGLAIAATIVNAHKGKISVRSEPGKWARFTVVL